MIERLRHFVVSSLEDALNLTGTRPRGVYAAVAELLERYDVSPKDLTRFELKAFSQNGEDGVIQEILRRIGVGSRSFIEFGIGDGSEGNCVFLAQVLGWQGVFAEGDSAAHERLARRYAHTRGVTPLNAYLEPQNIEAVLLAAGAEQQPTVLSIDVDGNDYYLWEALESLRPRVVVVEYNGAIDPYVPLVQPYSPRGPDGTAFFGASLAALESLGRRKGYRLVHTELAGVNGFFVREDLAADHFLPIEEVPRRTANYYLDQITMHSPASVDREYLVPPEPRE